ncbi:hypothetical protein OT109_01585 [Phycisphaeraceae bacterium D3-23]
MVPVVRPREVRGRWIELVALVLRCVLCAWRGLAARWTRDAIFAEAAEVGRLGAARWVRIAPDRGRRVLDGEA